MTMILLLIPKKVLDGKYGNDCSKNGDRALDNWCCNLVSIDDDSGDLILLGVRSDNTLYDEGGELIAFGVWSDSNTFNDDVDNEGLSRSKFAS
jgi:hypothetical protein